MIKTFPLATTYLDSDGDKLMPGALKLPTGKTVKITHGFNAANLVGLVSEIKEDKGEFICTGHFKTDPTGLYPAIGFTVIKSHMEGTVRVLDEVKLYQVSVSPNPNSDKSIKPIK